MNCNFFSLVLCIPGSEIRKFDNCPKPVEYWKLLHKLLHCPFPNYNCPKWDFELPKEVQNYPNLAELPVILLPAPYNIKLGADIIFLLLLFHIMMVSVVLVYVFLMAHIYIHNLLISMGNQCMSIAFWFLSNELNWKK